MSAIEPGERSGVSIVVVTYNGRDLLAECLPKVLEQARNRDAEVVVVDNGSVDGTADHVAQTYPEIVLQPNRRNEGFAGGVNAGVRAARGEVVVLLNDDARPRSGWLDALLRPLDEPEVAVSCSVVYEERYPPEYALGTGSISVIGHPIPNVARDPTRPFYATGCSLAFKRSLLGQPFDSLFFAYFEDTLLSWRARLLGYEVVRALDSAVDHLGSATARRQPGRMLFYWERNKGLLLLLTYRWGTLLRLLPLYVFDGLLRVAEDAWLLVRRPAGNRRSLGAILTRYGAAFRAIGWLAAHAGTVATLRANVQGGRRVDDRVITAGLSGKIFDDLVPTPVHRVANALAIAYCRSVGIPTAETDGTRRADGSLATSRSVAVN